MSLAQDLRFTLRGHRREPAFVVTALILLVVGLGGAAVILSIANVVLVHPLPYPDGGDLVLVAEGNESKGAQRMSSSPADFVAYRDHLEALRYVAAYRQTEPTLVSGEGAAERLAGLAVAGDFFAVFGVPPVAGTTFDAAVAGPGERQAVLGHALWQRRFAADPAVVGSSVELDGEPYRVAGVMPPGFRFPRDAEVWYPLQLEPEQWSDREGRYLRVVGRLAPEASREQAAEEIGALSARLARQGGGDDGWRASLDSLAERAVEPVRSGVLALLAAGALLLLATVANLANLLLLHAAGRQREVASRAALGAGRGRLARQLLLESSTLTLAGGVLSLAAAAAATRLLVRSTPQLALRWREIGVDPWVASITLALALAVGLAAGLAPVLHLRHNALSAQLAAGAPRSGTRRRQRGAKLLAAAQVALSFVLLAGAGLLLRSFDSVMEVDAGFDPRRVLTVSLELPTTAYPQDTDRTAFYFAAVERMRALPAVEAAGGISSLPLAGPNNFVPYSIPGRTATDSDYAPFYAVTPGFFEALGVPIREGRSFRESDRRATPGATILSESLALRLFPIGDPLGRDILLGSGEWARPTRVVGIAADVRFQSLEGEAGPAIYGMYDQAPFTAMTLVLRTAGDPASLAPATRRTLARLDPRLAPGEIRPMEEVVDEAVFERRFYLSAMGLFAVLSALLAAAGLYGVLSRAVAQRTRELGIRMALGADRGRVRRLVASYAATIVVPGLLAGLAGALAAGRLLASQLFAVSPSDPRTLAATAALLLAVGVAAAWAPARRATRVDPATALRLE